MAGTSEGKDIPDMITFWKGSRKEKGKERKARFWRRPRSCLGLLGILVVLYGVATAILVRRADRAFRGPEPGSVETAFSWERELGSHGPRPASDPSVPVPPGEPLGDWVLPQVLSVEDASESREGWVILDRRFGKLHLLDPRRGLVKSMGREGKGPGELFAPRALAVHDTLIWLVTRNGMMLDRFSLDGGFQGRMRLGAGVCPVGLVKDLVALESGRLVLLRFCPSVTPGPGTLWLEDLHPSGRVTPLLSLALSEPDDRRLHPFRMPVLARRGEDVVLGTFDAPCLLFIRPDDPGAPPRRSCLPDYRRPAVPTADRESLGRKFEHITRLGFDALRVPEKLPWLDGVFGIGRGVVARRMQGTERRDLVLLPSEGEARVYDLPVTERTFVGEETILVANDRLQGTEIRIYTNPWR
jgi:hypothetical protein